MNPLLKFAGKAFTEAVLKIIQDQDSPKTFEEIQTLVYNSYSEAVGTPDQFFLSFYQHLQHLLDSAVEHKQLIRLPDGRYICTLSLTDFNEVFEEGRKIAFLYTLLDSAQAVNGLRMENVVDFCTQLGLTDPQKQEFALGALAKYNLIIFVTKDGTPLPPDDSSAPDGMRFRVNNVEHIHPWAKVKSDAFQTFAQRGGEKPPRNFLYGLFVIHRLLQEMKVRRYYTKESLLNSPEAKGNFSPDDLDNVKFPITSAELPSRQEIFLATATDF